MWIIIVPVFIAMIWCCRLTSYRRQFRRWPGPLGLPFIGILLKIESFGRFHQTLTRWSKKYGKMFRIKILGQRSIVLRSASVTEKVLDNIRMTGRKSTFFQKYIFNDKSIGFASFEGRVPQLLNTFKHVLYWNWELRETTDPGLDLSVRTFNTQLLKRRKYSHNLQEDLKTLMNDVFTCLVSSESYYVWFTDHSKAVLLFGSFYVFSVLCLLCLCALLFICALWSPAGKGLTTWLSFVVSNCEFVTFPLVSWVRCGT